MKIIITILFCVILSACSSTKVHLYTRYLSDADIAKIKQKLEKENFDVETNTLIFPSSVQQSTILHSLFLQDEKALDIVANVLTELGWPIDRIKPVVEGNHWYLKNSMGLLIVPEGAKPQGQIAPQDLVLEYKSQDCNTPLMMHLNRDGSYNFIFKDPAANAESHAKGHWKITSYPYIELLSLNEAWIFYFEIETKTEVDKVSEIDIIELKPIDEYEPFAGCSFVHGLRK